LALAVSDGDIPNVLTAIASVSEYSSNYLFIIYRILMIDE